MLDCGMPKRKQTPPRPRDLNQLAVHIGKIAIHEIEDVPPSQPTKFQVRAAKGGLARAKALSRKKRVAIARKGARASARKRAR